MGWIPVTAVVCRKPETSGITTAFEVVLTIERQLVIVLAADPGDVVHPVEPINRLLLLAEAILPCMPLVIVTGADAVRELVFTACSVPVAEPNGVPATNKVELLSIPAVAAETGIVVPMVEPFRFTFTTLAATPPHSLPQFKTQNVLSLLSDVSKTAV